MKDCALLENEDPPLIVIVGYEILSCVHTVDAVGRLGKSMLSRHCTVSFDIDRRRRIYVDTALGQRVGQKVGHLRPKSRVQNVAVVGEIEL